jgi:hypothetical protein
MADASRRTRRGDGHTKSEMNRNREQSFGGAMTTRRNTPSDAPGLSSARSRSTRSGADQSESVTAGRAGSGGSGGTGVSRDALPDQANRPGAGIKRRKRGRGGH